MAKGMRRLLAGIAIVVLILWGGYALIMWEGSTTRAPAPRLESSVAQWLLTRTVPASARNQTNPRGAHAAAADLAAGRDVYRQKCEGCHGYDGSGRTEIGSGQYPHPPDLKAAVVQGQSDGELF